jgi:hypothetical protein
MNASQMQFFASIAGHAAQLAGSKMQSEHARIKLEELRSKIQHEEEMFAAQSQRANDRMAHEERALELRASLVRNIIDALVHRRVDALKSGFELVLSAYAAQAQHYFDQQRHFIDVQMKVKDPIESARCHARLSDIDIQLARIRSESLRLFREMSKTLVLLGGVPLSVSQSGQKVVHLIPEHTNG